MRLFLLLVWAVWWGGLGFYAAIVVPIGTDLIGSVEQGFITQQVTNRHNLLTAFFCVCVLIESIRARNRPLAGFVIGLAIIEAALVAFHWRLSAMLDIAARSVPSDFYSQHAIYLWLTTAEWLLGIALPLVLFRSRSES